MRILIIDDSSEFAKDSIFVEDITHKYKLNVDSIQFLEEAFNTLKDTRNRYRYDLILIDKKFESKYHCLDPIMESGVDLIKSLTEYNLPTPRVLFTATGRDADTIKKILGDYDCTYFFEKNEVDYEGEFIPKKFWSLPGYKRTMIQRRSEIELHLNNYFEKLSLKECNKWMSEVKLGEDAKWKNYNVKLLDGVYNIEHLFFDQANAISADEISEIIKQLLEKNTKIKLFTGQFADDVIIPLESYLSLAKPEADAVEIRIDRDTTNYLLNTLLILSMCDDDNDSIYELDNGNAIKSIATISNDHKEDIEIQFEWLLKKFVLRRTIGSIYSLFIAIDNFKKDYNINLAPKISADNEGKAVLLNLIKEGYSHPLENGDRVPDNQLLSKSFRFIYRGLGFNMTDIEKIINLHSSTRVCPFNPIFLDKETTWIKSKSENILSLRKCLDQIFESTKIRSLLPQDGDGLIMPFTDLVMFNKWYQNLGQTDIAIAHRVIEETSSNNNVRHYFSEYLPVSLAHFGAGRLGLGLVTPIINQLADKVVIFNRYTKKDRDTNKEITTYWQQCKDQNSIIIESNNNEVEYKYYHQNMSNDKKEAIRKEWIESSQIRLIVAADYKHFDDIVFFLKEVQHITTSLKSGLKRLAQFFDKIEYKSPVTIYPFENDRKDVDNLYNQLDDSQFEKSILIADRVCTHTELIEPTNKIRVYAEKYGNVVVNGSKVGNNLFRNEPTLKGIDYIFCEEKEEFDFHFNKKFRILNCVHASLAVMCYDKVMDKIPKDKWGEQYVNLLNDGKIKSDIEKVATAEVLKLITTTDKGVLERVFPSKDMGEIYNELKKYSNTIFNRFDGMADRLDRVLNLDNLIDKFDARIDDTINFFDGSNDAKINTIINEIPEGKKPNIKEIDTTLRALLRKVSTVNRKRYG